MYVYIDIYIYMYIFMYVYIRFYISYIYKMLERVWSAGLAKAKDQEGQTTGVGHPRGK